METDLLIEAVEKRTVLYDKSDSSRNRQFVNAKWREVAAELGRDETEVRTKWKRLHSYFFKLHRQVEAGDLTKITGKKQKHFYESLTFLIPYMRDKKKKTNMSLPYVDEEGDKEDVEDMDDNLPITSSSLSLDSQSHLNTRNDNAFGEHSSSEADDPIQKDGQVECSLAGVSAHDLSPRRATPKFSQGRRARRISAEPELLDVASHASMTLLDTDFEIEVFCQSLIPKMKAIQNIVDKMECQAQILLTVANFLKPSLCSAPCKIESE